MAGVASTSQAELVQRSVHSQEHLATAAAAVAVEVVSKNAENENANVHAPEYFGYCCGSLHQHTGSIRGQERNAERQKSLRTRTKAKINFGSRSPYRPFHHDSQLPLLRQSKTIQPC